MDRRIFFVGVIGGFVLATIVEYPLHNYLPGLFLMEWPKANPVLAWGLMILAVILLFGLGALTAQISGMRGRGAGAASGALAGLVAAFVAEVSCGGAAAGVWGIRSLFSSEVAPDFVSQLTVAILETHAWTSASAWIAAAGGAGLGALGGFLANADGPAGTPGPFFWLNLSVVGIISSGVTLVVSAVVFVLLAPSVLAAMTSIYNVVELSPSRLLFWPILVSFAFFIPWQIVGWQSLTRVPVETPQDYDTRTSALWIYVLVPLILIAMLGVIVPHVLLQPFSIVVLLISLGILMLTVRTGIQLGAQARPRLGSRPVLPRWYVWPVAIGGFTMMIVIYLGILSAAFNLYGLTMPLLSLIQPSDLASGNVPLNGKAVMDLVNANYTLHQTFLTYGGGMILLASLVTYFLASLVRQRQIKSG